MDEPAMTPEPGWYDDPERTGWIRWFDGTIWTSHAVSADEPRPDRIVEREVEGRTGEQVRVDGLQDVRPAGNVAVPRADEIPHDGGGGGLRAERSARLVDRIGPRGPVHLTRYLAASTGVLVLLTLSDRRHRALLGVLAVGFLVAAVVFGVRQIRERARWRRLGDEP